MRNFLQSRILTMTLATALLSVVLPSGADEGDKHDAKKPDGTKITPLLSKEFADIAGKEGLMLTVEYAPGASTPKHRHDAHTFVYVLEGSIVMQVEGGEPVTLRAGQTFYETPQDVHAVSKNASKTKRAKFLVFIVKAKGAPPVIPAN